MTADVWRWSGRLAALVAPAVLALAGQAQEPHVFRAATDLVEIDVSVRAGKSLVKGLTAADFELSDNGVRQHIDAMSVEQVPIDLTLILDTSASTADVIERFKSRAQQLTDMLRPDDRVRLITFAIDVIEVVPLRSGSARLPVEGLAAQGGTSLHDALLFSLMRSPSHGRRHLIVAFTDGVDTTSVIDAATLATVAGRAGGVLHLVLSGIYGSDTSLPPAAKSLRLAAEETGGLMHPPGNFNDAVDAFKRVFEDFRQSYVLRYILQGVKPEGWHSVTVQLKKPDARRYTVHAKKGYFGG